MATITILTPAGQDARILTAFGRRLKLKDGSNNPRDATAAEVKNYIMAVLILVVKEEEIDAKRATDDASVTPVTPT